MKIIVMDYPQTFEFETKLEFPKFQGMKLIVSKQTDIKRCKKRQELLLAELNKQDIHSPTHAYEDYVIENVHKMPFGELWYLGS
jgi:hypothetical protein